MSHRDGPRARLRRGRRRIPGQGKGDRAAEAEIRAEEGEEGLALFLGGLLSQRRGKLKSGAGRVLTALAAPEQNLAHVRFRDEGCVTTEMGAKRTLAYDS